MKSNRLKRSLRLFIILSIFASCSSDLLETLPGTKGSTVIAISGLDQTVTETTAVLTWTTAVAATHFVEYGTTSGAYSFSTVPSTILETAHSVTLTGLTASTKYYFRITGIDADNSASAGTEGNFTTSASAVIPVTHPTQEEKLRGIWLVGGLSESTVDTVVGQIDLYDPETDVWYPAVTSLPTPVSFAGVCSWKGKLYVFGGFDSLGDLQNSVQIYDPANDVWVSGTNMTFARANARAVVASDKIYILGGTTANAALPWAGSMTTFEFTPNAVSPYDGGSWSTKTNFSAANLSNRFAAVFNDVIQNLGGRTAASTLIATHDGFSAFNNGLSQATDIAMTAIRAGMAGVMYQPDSAPAALVIVGGMATLTGTTGNYIFQGTTVGTATNLVQFLFYPFTNPPITAGWQSSVNPYPVAIGLASAAVYGSRMFVFGGASNGVGALGLSNVYSIDLSGLPSGTWTAGTSLPVGRFGHEAVTIRQ